MRKYGSSNAVLIASTSPPIVKESPDYSEVVFHQLDVEAWSLGDEIPVLCARSQYSEQYSELHKVVKMYAFLVLDYCVCWTDTNNRKSILSSMFCSRIWLVSWCVSYCTETSFRCTHICCPSSCHHRILIIQLITNSHNKYLVNEFCYSLSTLIQYDMILHMLYIWEDITLQWCHISVMAFQIAGNWTVC